MKKLYILLIFLLNCTFLFSQDNIIKWTEDRPLTWNDFKIINKNNHWAGAISHCGLQRSSVIEGDTLIFKLEPYFNKYKSWVKTAHKNDIVLQHEQIHFDLTEFYARKIRREILQISLSKEDYLSTIDSLYNTYVNELNLINKQYDDETYFGNIDEVQSIWRERINKELLELDPYKETKLKVKLN